MGDLFEPVLELKQQLPNLKGLAASAAEGKPETFEIAAQADEKPKPRRRISATKAEKQPTAAKRGRKV